MKAAYLNMRTDPLLREQVEISAQERGLSMTQEVERLVRKALAVEAKSA